MAVLELVPQPKAILHSVSGPTEDHSTGITTITFRTDHGAVFHRVEETTGEVRWYRERPTPQQSA